MLPFCAAVSGVQQQGPAAADIPRNLPQMCLHPVLTKSVAGLESHAPIPGPAGDPRDAACEPGPSGWGQSPWPPPAPSSPRPNLGMMHIHRHPPHVHHSPHKPFSGRVCFRNLLFGHGNSLTPPRSRWTIVRVNQVECRTAYFPSGTCSQAVAILASADFLRQ